MKKLPLALLSLAFLLLCVAHKAVGADVPAIKEASAPALLKQIPKLKPADWVMLPGLEIKVLATVHKTETGITLAPGDVYIVIPHPADQWTQGPVQKYTKTIWNTGELNLKWFVGAEEHDASDGMDGCVIKGDGPLEIGHGDANAGDNWGFIRVKLVKVLPTKSAKK